jgi:hypothetical protein
MTKRKRGSKFPSDTCDRPPAHKKQQKQMPSPTALILSVLVPSYITVCFLVTGMDKGQIMADLTLKVANWFELQAKITRTTK